MAIAAVLILASCSKEPATTQETGNSIIIKNFAFSPAEITVKTGTTITWTNEDSVTHTITSEGNFDSGQISKGETFSFTPDKAGTIDYHCSIHPSMNGKIVVTE
ncbi:cupredoxin family copper-binding protein [Candidatus Woesearchaeota archaeon]|nr:cupredoxin family copper-binding protein [Candidatus Woesearchaeota archaeon]